MSLFDRMCGCFERLGRAAPPVDGVVTSALLAAARRSALIQYTPEANQLRREQSDVSGREVDWGVLFLPFGHTAVEDEDGVVVLIDAGRASPEWRARIALWDIAKPTPGTASKPEGLRAFAAINFRKDLDADLGYYAAFGVVGVPSGVSTRAMLYVDFVDLMAFDSRCAYVGYSRLQPGVAQGKWSKEEASVFCSDFVRDVGVGLHEIDYFNSPDVIVVRASGESIVAGEDRRKGHIPRSHERIRYMAIPHKKVLRIMRPDGAADPVPLAHGHPRRAHWKELLSPRFTHKLGQRVRVRETWVGPKSVVRQGVKYEVFLGTPEELSSGNAGART